MRDKVLAVLLCLSLCANVYLLFFENPVIDQTARKITNQTSYLGRGFVANASPSDTYYTDSDGYVSVNISREDPLGNETPVVSLDNTTPPVNITPETTLPTAVPTTVNATPVPTPVSDGWSNYSSKTYGYSLRYPNTWNLNEAPSGRTVLTLTAPDEKECPTDGTQCLKYTAVMTIDIDAAPSTPYADEYFTQTVAALQNKYAITATSKSAMCLLSGARAFQIEFYTRDTRGNPERKYQQYYGLFDGKAYIISYTGPYSTDHDVYAKNKGDFQRIIDSIVINRNYKEG